MVLVGDTDMLNDRVCVSVQKVMGHRHGFVPPMATLTLSKAWWSNFAGDDDLIKSRSRRQHEPPIYPPQRHGKQSRQAMGGEIRFWQSKRLETDQKIKELQMHGAAGQSQEIILWPTRNGSWITTAKPSSRRKDLKQVRKNLRQDTDALEFRIKVINIGAMPILVALSGLCLAILKTKQRGAK